MATLMVLVALTVAWPAAHATSADYAEVSQLLGASQASQALAAADRYLVNRPRDPQMRFLRAQALTALGRTADAQAVYVSLTQDYPELPEPHNNLAVLYAAQGQFDRARASLETAIATHPGYAAAHENLGDVLVQLALRAYATAQSLEPARPEPGRKAALVQSLALTPPSR